MTSTTSTASNTTKKFHRFIKDKNEELSNLFTLLIPTYNRSETLKKLIHYLQAFDVSFTILVLDSSDSEIQIINADFIAKVGSGNLARTNSKVPLKIQHISYPNTTKPFSKFADGFQRVNTPFSALAADDDILFIDTIYDCIVYLRENPEYSLAHGIYFDFTSLPEGWYIDRVIYARPSLTHSSSLERVCRFIQNYEATTYAIQRTEIAKEVFSKAKDLNSILGHELLSSVLCVAKGKAARLPKLYCGRNNERTISYSRWHPIEQVAYSVATLFSEYNEYRKILFETLENSSFEDEKEIKKINPTLEIKNLIDIAHLCYMSSFLHPKLLDFILNKKLNYFLASDCSIASDNINTSNSFNATNTPISFSTELWQFWAQLNCLGQFNDYVPLSKKIKLMLVKIKNHFAPEFSFTQTIHQKFGKWLGDVILNEPTPKGIRRYYFTKSFLRQLVNKERNNSSHQFELETITHFLNQYY